jgi:hypothetical protein
MEDETMPAYSATESPVSAVSWGAVIAGALTAWAVSLIIVTIGSAVGFSVISPYNHSNVSATEFHVAIGVFTLVTAFIASMLGGYITGRLRTRWVDVHTDEVYFRDTAHGLLSWALATFIGAALVALSATAVATGAASNPANGVNTSMTQQRTTTAMQGSAYTNRLASNPASSSSPTPAQQGTAYTDTSSAATPDDEVTSATTAATTTSGQRPAANVNDEETARKVASRISLWLAAGMLIGAFASSLAATWGGNIRDRAVPTV